jgi:RimJ/RimL family protein N-acetyltransferase
MSDAVDALMHYLFQRYPIEKITAYANLDNIGSQRVLEKCGFQNVGEEDQKSPGGHHNRVYRFDALARNTNACRLVPARVLTYATNRIDLEA